MPKAQPTYSQEQWTRAMNALESGTYADEPEKEQILMQRVQEYNDLSGEQFKRDSSVSGSGVMATINPQVWYEPSVDRVKQWFSDNPKMFQRLGGEPVDVDKKSGEVALDKDTQLLYQRAAEAMYAQAYDNAKQGGMTLHRYRDMEPGVGALASWLMGKAAGGLSGAVQGVPVVGPMALAGAGRALEEAGGALPGSTEGLMAAPEEQLGGALGFASRVAGGVGGLANFLPNVGTGLLKGAAQVGARAPLSTVLGRAGAASGVGAAIGGVSEAGQVAGEAIAGRDISGEELGGRVGFGALAGGALGLGGELVGALSNKLPAYMAESDDIGPGLDALRKAGGDTNFGLVGVDLGQQLKQRVSEAQATRGASYTSPGLQESLLQKTAPKVFEKSKQAIGVLRDADAAFKTSKEGLEQFHSVGPALDRAVDVVTRREGVPFADSSKVMKELPRLVEQKAVPEGQLDELVERGWRVLTEEDPIYQALKPSKTEVGRGEALVYRPKQLNAQQLDESIDALDKLARAGSKEGASDPAYRELEGAIRETRDQFTLDGKKGGWSELNRKLHEAMDDFGDTAGGKGASNTPWQKLADSEQKGIEQAVLRKVGRERFNEAMAVFGDADLMKELQELRASEFVRSLSKKGEIRGPLNNYDWIKLRGDALARATASTAGSEVQKLPNLSNKLLRRIGALRGGSAARGPTVDLEALTTLLGMSELYDSMTHKKRPEFGDDTTEAP